MDESEKKTRERGFSASSALDSLNLSVCTEKKSADSVCVVLSSVSALSVVECLNFFLFEIELFFLNLDNS